MNEILCLLAAANLAMSLWSRDLNGSLGWLFGFVMALKLLLLTTT